MTYFELCLGDLRSRPSLARLVYEFDIVTVIAVALGFYIVTSKIEDFTFRDIKEDLIFENLNVAINNPDERN